MAKQKQQEIVWEHDDATEANKLSGRNASGVDADWQEALVSIYRQYRIAFGSSQGLSDRELDLACIAAESMVQVRKVTRLKPVWFIADGVRVVGFSKPARKKSLPLLQGLDRLTDWRFGEEDDD